MGVTVREKDGAWWVFVHHQGRRKAKRIGVGPQKKKAAETAAGKIAAKLALGDFSALEQQEQPLTLREYADRWLSVYAKVHCKPSTVANYQRTLQHHVYPTLGDRPLPTLTRGDIKGWIAGMLAGGNLRSKGKALDPRSVYSFLIPFQAVLAAAVDDGLLASNPAARTGRFATNRQVSQKDQLDIFTAEELRNLLTTCQGHFPESRPLVLTLARTGMRIGEASALAWEDVDLARGFLLVRRGYSKRRMSTPKSGKGRCVDMSQQLRATLAEYQNSRTIQATVDGKTLSPWVFGGLDGKPMDYEGWTRRVWTPLLTLAGLRLRGPHQFRHTYASLLLMAGESPAYVQRQLGHASIKMTVDLYGHWIPGANRQAVDRLDDPEVGFGATKSNPGATENASIPVSAR